MNVSSHQLESIIKSCKIFKSFIQVEKIGLCDTTMNKSTVQPKEPISFNIKSISFFTKEPSLIFSKDFQSQNDLIITNTEPPELYCSLIKKVLLQKDYTTSASSSPFYINNEEISFTKFTISTNKYHILNIHKSNIIILSKFSISTKTPMIKLYLFHIAIGFFNFIGTQSNYINGINIHSSVNDSFNAKLFEMFLFLPITKHFSNLTINLFKKTDLHLVNIKYKTFYLVDLSSNEVLFSLHSTRNSFKRGKMIELNEMLWQELMYHCNNLKVQYIKKYQNRFDSFEYQDFFVKMENSSTYPRLTFVIKFLPLLKGMALIHVYSQNKLSRNDEGKRKKYKEFDIMYGNDISSDSANIEYRYKEPKKLKETEWFFIEFLLSCNSSFGFFFYPKFDLKYYDTTLLKIIEEAIGKENNNQGTCDKIIQKITNDLYEEYLFLNEKDNKENNNKEPCLISNGNNTSKGVITHTATATGIVTTHNNNEDNDINSLKKNEMISNYQWNCISKNNEGLALYQIDFRFVLRELFSSKTIQPDINPDDITMILSQLNDKSYIDNDQHLSQLINNDISNITKMYTGKNTDKEKDKDKSLFGINITAIGKTPGEGHTVPHHKHCKSDLVINLNLHKQTGPINNTVLNEQKLLNINFTSRDDEDIQYDKNQKNSCSSDDGHKSDRSFKEEKKGKSSNVCKGYKKKHA